MKFYLPSLADAGEFRRSREGAWIEMSALGLEPMPLTVAPARERGLKCRSSGSNAATPRRSREGAWIEIPGAEPRRPPTPRRSREGAWIEIGTPCAWR